MISVVLSRPRKFNLVSWLIRAIISFPASHASIHVAGRGLFAGQPMVLEATGDRGVSLVHRRQWSGQNLVVFQFNLQEKYAEAGDLSLASMLKALGENYDLRGLLSFGWRLFLRHFLGIRTRVHSTPNEMFCSEVVARWLISLRRLLSLQGIDVLPPDETSPADLVRVIQELGVFDQTVGKAL